MDCREIVAAICDEILSHPIIPTLDRDRWRWAVCRHRIDPIRLICIYCGITLRDLAGKIHLEN